MSVPSWLCGNANGQWAGIDDIDVANQVVIVRVDYNIPANNYLPTPDAYRIEASLPTIKTLVERKARVVLLSHRGRPAGHVVPALSTQPLALRLEELLDIPVDYVPDCIGRGVEQAIEELPAGRILLLENTRFHLGEQLNQQVFLRQLARLGDIFVNEAFPAIHRAHASLSGLAACMPTSALGLRATTEIEWLRKMMDAPKQPMCAMVGGHQLSLALDMMKKLIGHVDTIMIGGTIANSFMMARDYPIGLSRYDTNFLEDIRDFMAEAGIRGCRIFLPQDYCVRFSNLTETDVFTATKVPAHATLCDIGPQTVANWGKLLQTMRTVIWIDEMNQNTLPPDSACSNAQLAQAVKASRATSMVGGDEVVGRLSQQNCLGDFSFVSCGSAVLMTALSGLSLPALQVLRARMKDGGLPQDRRVTDLNN